MKFHLEYRMHSIEQCKDLLIWAFEKFPLKLHCETLKHSHWPYPTYPIEFVAGFVASHLRVKTGGVEKRFKWIEN